MNRFKRMLPLVILMLFSITTEAQEDLDKSASRLAIGAIVSDREVPDSVLYVQRLAASMSTETRYEFLSDWVLPSPSHSTFRLALDFTTTNPAPISASISPKDLPLKNETVARAPPGGALVSPALDLVEAAKTLGRLAELRSRIERVASHDELQQRCRLTMLGLVDLAAGEHEKAATWFDELFSRVETGTFDDFAGRWPETLAVHAGVRHAGTRDVAVTMLYRMLEAQVRSGVAHGPDAWDRWVTATGSQMTGLRSLKGIDDATESSATSEVGSYWLRVSKTTAWSRGHGMPNAAWLRQSGMVANVASHDEDYLYYRIPLRGDFEVECDVTSFDWRDSHLMTAGTYVAPIYDHVSYGLGSFRAARASGVIEPRLSQCDEWMRYRAVVRDRTCATYFNGRLIHTEPLTVEHDPWLAIRSGWHTDGAVRNLRITGKPEIPEQIRLTASSDLTGWCAYFGESVGGQYDHWRPSGDPAKGGGIVGQYASWLHGRACERLLQYHRPMLEDGTIEYEFYYREGSSLVHPALDRRAWILDPKGINIHWITDGNFERSGLDPLNRIEEPENQRGSVPLALRPNDWNRVQLVLTGDVVELVLNGEVAYHGRLESTNQRTFGLFYWSDKTEAQVRNVTWRGEWPRQLPPVESQEFSGEGTRALDERLPQLTARFEHNFAQDGLPLNRFTVEVAFLDKVKVTNDGLRVVVQARKGYTPCWIGAKLRLHGDFDVSAEFERLELSGNEDSSTGVFLMTVTDDPELTHSSVYRGRLRKPNAFDRIVAQAEFNRRKPGGRWLTWPGSTAEECTSGTLRLARRGDTIYCLLAEADSINFRLIHKEVVPTESTLFGGVRLQASIYSAIDTMCEVAVTWKRLSIRGEKITDLRLPESDRVGISPH